MGKAAFFTWLCFVLIFFLNTQVRSLRLIGKMPKYMLLIILNT